MRFKAFVLCSAILLCVPARADDDTCSEEADRAFFAAKSWQDLHAWWKRFAPRCDDGYLAEGVSGTVTEWLAEGPDTITRLRRASARDAAFRRFVVSHVDTTARYRDLETIRNHARDRCPARASALCRELIAAAESALKEAGR
jgi:hypothetical protein